MKSTMLKIIAVSEVASGDLGSRSLSGKKAQSFMAKAGSRLACTAGRLWLTIAGDPTDYVLDAGQIMDLPVGRAVVSALGPNAAYSLR